MVHENPDAFVSTSRWGNTAVPFLTSGSTGVRLRIHHDAYSLLANIAFGERERQVITHLCGRSRGYRELYLLYARSTVLKVWDFYRDWTCVPIRPERVCVSVLAPFEHIAKTINQFRPDVLVGYGSYLEALFRMLMARGVRMHGPRVLLYGADAMSLEGRRLIEEECGIAVLSYYNAAECFKIGFFCEQRTHFHLHEDLCHVKIMNAQGGNAASGDTGEVVISNLVNRGTVLLNYRLGDVASVSNQPCSCGRTLLSLSDLEGRVEDIVSLPNGALVHPRAIWDVFKERPEVLRYQLIQQEPTRFALNLLTKDVLTYACLIEGIRADLRALLGTSAVIDTQYSPELAVPSAGKFRPVISHCTPTAPG
jgi:phenylacetate-CoA ligase